nr:MAG TPA: hypothetical protein [Bacteriophage sp.]
MRGQAHPPKNQDTRKSRRNAALFLITKGQTKLRC